jgi:hypothetical protein
MIQFPCKCGHRFNLPHDMAGGLTQCPDCGLLADVPTLSDLAHLGADGTILLNDAPLKSAADAVQSVAQMHRAYSNRTTDSRGVEKDLRPDAELFRRIGDEPTPEDAAAVYARPARPAPKYDPVTGERIRPLELKHRPDIPSAPIAAIPVVSIESPEAESAAELVAIPVHVAEPIPLRAAPPVKSISYASNATRRRVGPATLAIELFMPANTIVMFFVLLAYIAAGFAAHVLWVGSALIGFVSLQVLNLPVWLILAHYGAVIEDTGPDGRDELPRPLRNLSLGEDIINPFSWWALAGLICYWPALLCALPRVPVSDDLRPILIAAFALAGSALMPAVLLTTVAGSTLENLRPDRLLGVILSCGVEYIVSIGAFLLAALSAAIILIPPPAVAVLLRNPVLIRLREPYFFMPLLTISVYLGHYFAWHLGLMYQAHHEEFPWVMQRHISTRRR